MRLTTRLFYAGKVILCIDFVVFCLRLMAIFTISRTLGPKIIIVRKMVRVTLQNSGSLRRHLVSVVGWCPLV